MQVQVLLFAMLRERAGVESTLLELPDGADVTAALALLGARFTSLPALFPRVQVARNQKMVPLTEVLANGDELALIPPVSGGSGRPPVGGRLIAVTPEKLSLDEAMTAVQGPEQGAVLTFTGCVRRNGQIESVEHLDYEAHVPMAEAALKKIADDLSLEYPGVKVAIHHRIGRLVVGDVAVIIAVSAPHRAEAFGACRVAIERLKQRVPIWKKETGAGGAVWIGMGA